MDNGGLCLVVNAAVAQTDCSGRRRALGGGLASACSARKLPTSTGRPLTKHFPAHLRQPKVHQVQLVGARRAGLAQQKVLGLHVTVHIAAGTWGELFQSATKQ